MNMIKKFALGCSALAMSSALVACSDDGGGSVSDITITAAGTGKWTVDGVVMADNNIFDVKYKLSDPHGKQVDSAVYAYTVKEVNPDTNENLLELQLGKGVGTVPGLETEIFQSNMNGACGTMTLTVTAIVEGSGLTGGNGEAVELEPVTGTFEVACGTAGDKDKPEIPEVPEVDPTATLTEASVNLGGAKSNLASSLDLDAGMAYTSAQVLADGFDKTIIDVIFSGSKIMTPYGTSAANYMSKTYNGVNNGAGLIKVDATAAAAAKTVNDMIDLWGEKDVINVSAVTAGEAYLVITEQTVPVLIIIDTFNTTAQEITVKYFKEAAAQ